MRDCDRKKMMKTLEDLAKWLAVMATMTRDAEMKKKHKERAKAVDTAITILEETHESTV